MHHESIEGKLFQDPVNSEKFLVYEWFEHSPGIIRAVRKTSAHQCAMCDKWIPKDVPCCIEHRKAYAQKYDHFG